MNPSVVVIGLVLLGLGVQGYGDHGYGDQGYGDYGDQDQGYGDYGNYGNQGGNRVCYFSSWAKYRSGPPFVPEQINATLCTHLVYAYAKIKDNDIVMYEDDDDTLQKLRDLQKKNKDLKLILSVGGYANGVDEFVKTASSKENILEFAFNAILHVNMHQFDGLSLDWEFPGDQGISHKDHFTDLVKGVREVFQIESDVMRMDRLLLSAAVSAFPPVIDRSYNVPEISKYLDLIHVMTYDMQGTNTDETRYHSPLYARPSDTGDNLYRNQDFAITHWIDAGAPPIKLVMGLATYGRTFTLADDNVYSDGSPASGIGSPGPYTRKPGLLGFYEICTNLQNGWGTAFDTIQIASMAWYGDQWVGYDDMTTFIMKATYISDKRLGGAMFWLDYDDFSDVCNLGMFPLINAVKDVFGTAPPSTQAPTTARLTTTTSTPRTTTTTTTTTPRPTTTTSTPRPTTTTTTTTPTPTTTQPANTGGGCTAPTTCSGTFMADPCNPNKFYQCAHGQLYHMSCNVNLVWKGSYCGWPANRREVNGYNKDTEAEKKAPIYVIRRKKLRNNAISPYRGDVHGVSSARSNSIAVLDEEVKMKESLLDKEDRLMTELRHLLNKVKSETGRKQ
ncbi:chitinase-3-like protein 1 [Argopecten irradians]|uniref:chitinase-3-like protein 1 n=1 Tax=Argopecten irradians TaxID=31199 RepID=UPI00371427C2